ncbi:malate synthase A [Oceanobacillus indicireducens]|uniref:Malate synthase n=1 Tax=Oceanobacillus indicireducens TaxID=1004261 RepID=A0A918D3I2_9BACI|nr:malate synthase A [Oceanobacillus indicireducens]GGN61637.1 malate synthase [Oceanobacillus indicireducens]
MLTNQTSVSVQIEHEQTFPKILTPQALEFLGKLHEHFDERRRNLLEIRQQIQEKLNEGRQLQFLKETKHIREGDWTVGRLPKDLQDRRVEITGPVDRKMIINALNSGAKAFMADFEDATSPTWENMMNGQINLKDAIRRSIDFEADNGKRYELNEDTAVLIVRPRGWHLEERHLRCNGKSMSASLVDFGLYLYHNATELIARGTGPYFYLPKVENHLEARLWNEVFVFAQNELGIPQGTIKATVLIETITAAFEMDEILYELRDHAAGLNCGRWDYIFSYIKKFHKDPERILPDRATVTMEVPFMRSYSQLAIKTCHKRNAMAIGGMAAHIPVRNDEAKNKIAFDKVRKDKEREARDGHDGTWVAHPGMVELVKEVFDEIMPTPNQLHRKREDVEVTAEDLVQLPDGEITEEGLRTNVSVGIQYTAAWLSGRGAVPINHLMEDAATAEISRAQVWQWIRCPKGVLSDGRKVTFELVDKILQEELEKIKGQIGEAAYEQGNFAEAAEIFDSLVKEDEFAEFLTLPAYKQLTRGNK